MKYTLVVSRRYEEMISVDAVNVREAMKIGLEQAKKFSNGAHDREELVEASCTAVDAGAPARRFLA